MKDCTEAVSKMSKEDIKSILYKCSHFTYVRLELQDIISSDKNPNYLVADVQLIAREEVNPEGYRTIQNKDDIISNGPIIQRGYCRNKKIMFNDFEILSAVFDEKEYQQAVLCQLPKESKRQYLNKLSDYLLKNQVSKNTVEARVQELENNDFAMNKCNRLRVSRPIDEWFGNEAVVEKSVLSEPEVESITVIVNDESTTVSATSSSMEKVA